MPSLGAFRIPSWSVNTNPMYQRVATRRAQAAMSSGEGLVRNAARVLERVNEEGGSGSITPGGGDGRVRPLEDPYLVGDVAAARARRERLARENVDDVLQREDRRWDWFLGRFAEPLFPAVSGPLPRVPPCGCVFRFCSWERSDHGD